PVDEETTIANLRTIYVAMGTYSLSHNGEFGTMYDLVDNGLLDMRFQCRAVSGYKFVIRLREYGKNYEATAEPVAPTGHHFFATRDGTIHYEENRPATTTSPKVSFPR